MTPERIERLLYRPKEAAAAIGLSPAKIYQLMASGEVPSVKIGKSRRIPVEALHAWVAKATEPGW
jgi:excisionase family DNA binding protein